ncbi:MAG: hypothetical protein WC451_01075 [Patescibacteria group bacterium]
MIKNKVDLIFRLLGVAILFALALFFINNRFTLFYRVHQIDNLRILIPLQFYQEKKIGDNITYFSTMKNLHNLDDSLSVEIYNKKFDRYSIDTLGGILDQKYINEIEYSGKHFISWSDGDAGYGSENFVYEIPGSGKYIRIRFIYNVESSWDLSRDEKTILSNIKIN